MFGFVTADLSLLWGRPPLPDPLDFTGVFGRFIDLFYLVDVLLAGVAYTLTFRVLDTHVRSVEPTLGGWVICLLCYQPFVRGVGANYLLYDQDGLEWTGLFAAWPWLSAAWGCIILVLVFIYAWSTAAFGLRFSNLTNRGIITNGPYRWLRHPAYLSKNLSWWMIAVPFVSTTDWSSALQACLLLCGVNLVYFTRARTEERHLLRDPVYREYSAFIAQHGLAAEIRRALGRQSTGSSQAASARAPVA
jgi:protein-S-isoprenylcysteine O-methyltransferase Ste14